jgi:Tol biopolymer transport system component
MTPVWSKDSQRLAYIRGDEIWIMSKSGAGAVNITNSPAPERGVSWSR